MGICRDFPADGSGKCFPADPFRGCVDLCRFFDHLLQSDKTAGDPFGNVGFPAGSGCAVWVGEDLADRKIASVWI